MKSSEKNTYKEIEEAFESIFSEEFYDFETDAKVMASKCLSEIQIITEARNISRKKVAEMIGTSPSYLTQLYRGNKLMNWVTMAKLKKALDLDIEIRIKNNCFDNTIAEGHDYSRKIIMPHTGINWSIIKNISNHDNSEQKYLHKQTDDLMKKKITA
jgi:transcriptional regulator with XRE-family HTH domain